MADGRKIRTDHPFNPRRRAPLAPQESAFQRSLLVPQEREAQHTSATPQEQAVDNVVSVLHEQATPNWSFASQEQVVHNNPAAITPQEQAAQCSFFVPQERIAHHNATAPQEHAASSTALTPQDQAMPSSAFAPQEQAGPSRASASALDEQAVPSNISKGSKAGRWQRCSNCGKYHRPPCDPEIATRTQARRRATAAQEQAHTDKWDNQSKTGSSSNRSNKRPAPGQESCSTARKLRRYDRQSHLPTFQQQIASVGDSTPSQDLTAQPSSSGPAHGSPGYDFGSEAANFTVIMEAMARVDRGEAVDFVVMMEAIERFRSSPMAPILSAMFGGMNTTFTPNQPAPAQASPSANRGPQNRGPTNNGPSSSSSGETKNVTSSKHAPGKRK